MAMLSRGLLRRRRTIDAHTYMYVGMSYIIIDSTSRKASGKMADLISLSRLTVMTMIRIGSSEVKPSSSRLQVPAGGPGGGGRLCQLLGPTVHLIQRKPWAFDA